MSEITDQIWLGSYADVANRNFLREREITHILCCADELPLRVGFPYSTTLEGYKVTGINWAQDAAEIMDKWVSEGKRVMVHCTDGLGRSASAVIEYLITYKKWSYQLAYDHIKLRRQIK
jgi:predicted protein tyrosine phosphatase